MRRAEDGVGMGKAVQAYVYRTWSTKGSRKYWGRVTQRALHTHKRAGAGVACAWQTATAQDPNETKERTVSLTQRHTKQRAKARKRRYLQAQERLARDRRQAQHAVKVLEQALEELGLPTDLVAEIEGRLRKQ